MLGRSAEGRLSEAQVMGGQLTATKQSSKKAFLSQVRREIGERRG